MNTMNAIPSLTLAIPMPQLSSIEVIDHLAVRVTWRAGIRAPRTETIDLSPLINSLKLYRPLRTDHELFRTAHLIENGRIVAWGNGEIDMPVESLEELAEEGMTADDFREFLTSNNLTHSEAAALLGYSRRQIENFLTGGLIPRVVVMACFGLLARNQLLRNPLVSSAHAHASVQVIDSNSIKTCTLHVTKQASLPATTTAPNIIVLKEVA